MQSLKHLFFIHIALLKTKATCQSDIICPTSPAPSPQLRPFLPDRKLPQEQEFMVIGALEPRVYLRQWTNGTCHCQEFNFSTQLDCKLLEYRNLTLLQLLQPSVLQVALLYFYMFYIWIPRFTKTLSLYNLISCVL